VRRKIGYAKLGRSMPLRLDKCNSLGGDVEMVPTLKLLAERHPDVDFVLIGRNSGEVPTDVGLPSNVTNPWIAWKPQIRNELNFNGLTYANLTVEDHIRVRNILTNMTEFTITQLDGIVMWLGQHGTTNTPLPSIKDRDVLTKQYDWATLYASYLLQGINAWRDRDPFNREEVLLNADVRNYVKYRDSKWPWRHPVLAQFNDVNNVKHERYASEQWCRDGWEATAMNDDSGRPVLWESKVRSVYSRLEISALIPGTPFGDTIQFNDDFDRPHDFGIIFNETRREVNLGASRRTALRDWVLPLHPGFIRGKWSEQTMRELDVRIEPVPVLEYFGQLQSTRTTLTTPASGSGWATAKPWECFAAGVVCFFHPLYDTQNNILGDADPSLHSFLRVSSVADLRERIEQVNTSHSLWQAVIRMQHNHYSNAVTELRYLKLIEARLGL
jgi:hypothetical protein